MSTPLIIKYPYDPTGLAETNIIIRRVSGQVEVLRKRLTIGTNSIN